MQDAGKKPLTERQREFYDFFCGFHSRTGSFPTHAETAEAMGLKSAACAAPAVRILVEKGWLVSSGQGRGHKYSFPEQQTLRRQYVRLRPGRGASIGGIFIGCVQQEGENGEIQVIEVISPESMGDLKPEV